MTKDNILPAENKKFFETVWELKDCEIKKSPLSPAARAKVIKMYGGNYVSENREDYGPCIINSQLNYDNCHCSSAELDRQLKIIRNKRELEALERERKEQREKELKEKIRIEREARRRERERECEERRQERANERIWKKIFGDDN